MTFDEFLQLIEPKRIYTVRFWNIANECIPIEGKYSRSYQSYEDAWKWAVEILPTAIEGKYSRSYQSYDLGPVCMDIDNEFFDILSDDHVVSSSINA